MDRYYRQAVDRSSRSCPLVFLTQICVGGGYYADIQRYGFISQTDNLLSCSTRSGFVCSSMGRSPISSSSIVVVTISRVQPCR